MLKRLYVDNFRCLVNFEIKFDRMNLLLGENGSGKTTVFEVLWKLQQLVVGESKVREIFPAEDLTRWETLDTQVLEVELEKGEDVFKYRLLIEHSKDRKQTCVKHESLMCTNSKSTPTGAVVSVGNLFLCNSGNATVLDERTNNHVECKYDLNRSGVGTFKGSPHMNRLNIFCIELEKLIIATVCPTMMSSESKSEDRALSRNMANFAAWYRFLSQEHQGQAFLIFQELKKVLPGFNSFNIKAEGEKTRILKVLFDLNHGSGRSISFDFGELSDGQRVLVALYSLLFGLKGQGYCLFLDEPDNYVALREIQPWLRELSDACDNGIEQVVLISHHPEIIDYLAMNSGRWFDRESNGPVRVSESPKETIEGMKASEGVARGWIA
ncbi:MAG TPA: AAA family ATPase [Planctomycetota bacterium]|nr:AAA family ATPase [Planctomycetota bacterium]